MSVNGPIIIVEDDQDDREMYEQAFETAQIKNERLYFQSAEEFTVYMRNTRDKALVILCDFYLPGKNGIDLKSKIESDFELRKKGIPFIFLTTSVSTKYVDTAYMDHVVQGFFMKQDSLSELIDMLTTIVAYWKMCEHPSTNK